MWSFRFFKISFQVEDDIKSDLKPEYFQEYLQIGKRQPNLHIDVVN